MADIRAGLRDNPTMYPFAATLTDAQELADVAAYIESLCIPGSSTASTTRSRAMPARTGRRRPTGKRLAEGKAMYEGLQDLPRRQRRGRQDKFYPVIAGQHYKYLLRQMTEIRDGHRRNANPDMVKVIKPYTNEQLISISAYQSSLSMPGSMCKPKAGAAPAKKK